LGPFLHSAFGQYCAGEELKVRKAKTDYEDEKEDDPKQEARGWP